MIIQINQYLQQKVQLAQQQNTSNMDTSNNSQTQQNSPNAYIGVSALDQPQQQKTNQLQQSTIIDQYKIASINQQFENQFQQNPRQVNESYITVQDEQKYRKISSNTIEPKQEKKSKLQQQKAKSNKESVNINKSNQAEMNNQTFPTLQSPAKNLKVAVLNNKQVDQANQKTKQQMQIERRVKEIAKSIRQRVKKQPKQFHPNNNKQVKLKPKQLQSNNKIQSRDIVLSPINKPNFIDFSSKLLTFQEDPQDTINAKHIVKEILKKQILGKMWNAIEIEEKANKYKLKLDPIKHKYPITTFRKAILQQGKSYCLQQQKKVKERQQKLLQRRVIFNNSRYDRYIKHQQHKKIHHQDEDDGRQGSLVLLKNQGNGSFLEQMQNPENKDKQDHNSIFPTEAQQGQTIQIPSQQENNKSQDNDYNEDFF